MTSVKQWAIDYLNSWGNLTGKQAAWRLAKNAFVYVGLPVGLVYGGFKLGESSGKVEKGNVQVENYEGFTFGDYIFVEESGQVVGVKLPPTGTFKVNTEKTFGRTSKLEHEVEEAFVEGDRFTLTQDTKTPKGKVSLKKK